MSIAYLQSLMISEFEEKNGSQEKAAANMVFKGCLLNISYPSDEHKY